MDLCALINRIIQPLQVAPTFFLTFNINFCNTSVKMSTKNWSEIGQHVIFSGYFGHIQAKSS